MEPRRTIKGAADPEGWRGTVDSLQLVRDNADALSQCGQAARAAGEDQQCTITVRMPRQ